MIRRPPRSTLDRSSAASDVYKRQVEEELSELLDLGARAQEELHDVDVVLHDGPVEDLSLIHISEPTRPY